MLDLGRPDDAVGRLISLALAEDVGPGDLTAEAVVPVAARGSARSDEKFDVHFLMKLIARGKFVDGPSSKWSSSFFKYLLKNERM